MATKRDRTTKVELQCELKAVNSELTAAVNELDAFKTRHAEALQDLDRAEAMLHAFAGQLDCVRRHYPSEASRLTISGHLVAIAKGWFGAHPVSSADQISRGARKLLQVAREEAWLYRAQENEAATAPPVEEAPTD